MRKLILSLLISLPLTSSAHAAHEKLDQFIAEQMVKYHIPGASIAIIKDKQISYTNAYGYADLEAKRKMTTDTYLQACSITKTTTALAVLMTFNNKELSIDDPANDFLTSWKIPKNKYTEKQPVTVRMLLDHSAGMLNPYEFFKYKSGDKYPSNLNILRGEKPALNPPLSPTRIPGSKYEYCNGCYVVLQTLLADVNHQPYPQVMNLMVLDPLNLSHSNFDLTFAFNNPDKIALPYTPDGKIYPDQPYLQINAQARKDYLSADQGLSVGGLWTTPSDLAKYAIAIQNSLANNNDYIPHSIAAEMVAPSSTKTRGLGFFISNQYGDETPGGKYFMHGGFNPGYLAILVAGKNNGSGVVIMVNVSPDYHTKGKVQQWDFIKDVERFVANDEKWN